MTRVISRLLLGARLAAPLAATLSVAPRLVAAQNAAPSAAPAAKTAPATEGKFLVRVRGLGLATADKSDAVPLLGLGADRISVSDVALAELDVTYFATANLALSVSGSYPVSHDAYINGTTIGTFKQTPLSARLQYHVLPTGRIRPYIGAGILVAPVSDVDLVASGIGRFDLESPLVGPVGQIGFDVKLGGGFFLNADARYALAKTTLKAGVNPVSELGLNPITFGGGIGYRF